MTKIIETRSAAKIIRCAPGMAKILLKEMQYRKVLRKGLKPTVLHQRNHDLIFLPRLDNPAGCKDLRLAEEVCRCLAFGKYKVSDSMLDKITAALQSRPPCKLVVTADGSHFDRRDMERWIAKELMRRRTRLSQDENAPLLWVFLMDEKFYFALQENTQTRAAFRNRRHREREGSLPVTIAAALVFAAHPRKNETMIDPVCGSGTLLAEAIAFQRELKSLSGFDTDGNACAIAAANTAHIRQCRISKGDGSRTGLDNGSMDIVLANMPFGKQFGHTDSNPHLYADILKEMLRLGRRPAWRGIFLTSDTGAFKQAMDSLPALASEVVFTVKIRGETANAYKVQKK